MNQEFNLLDTYNLSVIIKLWISVIVGDEKLLILQDIDWEIRWAIRIKCDSSHMNIILKNQSEHYVLFNITYKDTITSFKNLYRVDQVSFHSKYISCEINSNLYALAFRKLNVCRGYLYIYIYIYKVNSL